jgi:DNA-3-methyladenine glycosylase
MGLENTKLTATYFRQNNVVALAEALIGKKLVSCVEGIRASGLITETEAYRGWGDKACHAHLNRKTKRTAIMYKPGGVAHVYLCYGIHHLFNIVSNTRDNADDVLIRAIQPLEGVETMLARRKKLKLEPSLIASPGNLTKALGITTAHYGLPLTGDDIFIENTPEKPTVKSRKRIGIAYAKEDANLPWRFVWKNNPYLSKN